MIFGIGTDIVEIDRIKSLASLNKFAIKILSQKELRFFDSLGSEKKITYISKQFAGKEAVSKAIGKGITKETQLKNIEILRDKNGAPILNPTNNLEKIFRNLGITKTHVSLSDEKNYAIAIAILEK